MHHKKIFSIWQVVAPGYFATGLHSCGGSVDIDTAKHSKSLTSQDPVLTLSALQRLATPEARQMPIGFTGLSV